MIQCIDGSGLCFLVTKMPYLGVLERKPLSSTSACEGDEGGCVALCALWCARKATQDKQLSFQIAEETLSRYAGREFQEPPKASAADGSGFLASLISLQNSK